MKINNVRRKPASIAKTRWLAYAAAGAATTLVSTNSAEATIHYSGYLGEQFGPHRDKAKAFPLDQAGDSLLFIRSTQSRYYFAGFRITGIVSGSWRGFNSNDVYQYYVSKLPRGENISATENHFTSGRTNSLGQQKYGILDSASGGRRAEWTDRGIGFIGFRFNNGAGFQYGWARVRMSNSPENAFVVVDYAYADPGEPIRAGQRSSDEPIPDQGSLGWLALGAVGLLAWRKSRSRTARLKDA